MAEMSNKWLVYLVFGAVFALQTLIPSTIGAPPVEASSSVSTQQAPPHSNDRPGSILYNYDLGSSFLAQFNSNNIHQHAPRQRNRSSSILYKYDSNRLNLGKRNENRKRARNQAQGIRYENNNVHIGQDTYQREDIAQTDEELDAIIARITDEEEKMKELQRELAYKERGGPRQHKLALAQVDPASDQYEPSHECQICLSELGSEIGTITKLIKCGHLFHSDCLTKWSQIKDYYDQESICPICRVSFLENDSDADNEGKNDSSQPTLS